MTRGNQRRASGPKASSRQKKLFHIRRQSGRSNQTARIEPSFSQGSDKASASYLAIICLVVAIVTAAFVFHLYVRFEAVRLGYEMSQSRSERARLLIERRELRLELASLKSPQRVETEAREKLGMEMPDHHRIISIGKKRRPVLASGGAR